jgi:hypothetical protein
MSTLAFRSIDDLQAFALLAGAYANVRAKNPGTPAWACMSYLRAQEDGDQPCAVWRIAAGLGHEWNYSGTQYGGDDESYHGEGRCLCAYCGADGDS